MTSSAPNQHDAHEIRALSVSELNEVAGAFWQAVFGYIIAKVADELVDAAEWETPGKVIRCHDSRLIGRPNPGC